MFRTKLLASALLAIGLTTAWAQTDKGITPGEFALLHPFCMDAQTMNGYIRGERESPRAPYWYSKLGESFWDIHHYCWAQLAILRTQRVGISKRERDFGYQTSIGEWNYVVRRAKPGMVLLPEIHFLIGKSYVALEQHGQAIDSFKASIASKVDYWPPYAGMYDSYMVVNMRKEARDIIEAGLKLMPNEPELLKRAQALNNSGGTKTPAARTQKPRSSNSPAVSPVADGASASGAGK